MSTGWGPGKYDAECTAALHATGANAVLLIVLDGDRGHGFSMTATDPAYIARVPELLDQVSAQIRAAGEPPP